jgi:hypothetical protein
MSPHRAATLHFPVHALRKPAELPKKLMFFLEKGRIQKIILASAARGAAMGEK